MATSSATRPPGRPAAKPGAKKKSPLPLILSIVIPIVVVAAVIAVLVGGGDDKKSAIGDAAQFGKVTPTGTPLPELPDTGTDPGIGLVPPTLTGVDFEGKAKTITPGENGKPMMVLFAAHWCPHCQNELPLIEKWMAAGDAPKDLQVELVNTGYREEARNINWPPSAWLEKIKWPTRVLVDDLGSTAANSWGLPGFPYFVLLDKTGKVTARDSGELSMETVASLAAAAVAA